MNFLIDVIPNEVRNLSPEQIRDSSLALGITDRLCLIGVVFAWLCITGSPCFAESKFALKKTDTAVEVTLGNQLFTRYVFTGAMRPYLYPLIGPTGKPVTRSWPMEKREGESSDHPHHRSMWFTHGSVNGVDFWSEVPTAGKQVSREVKIVAPDRIIAINDWLTVDGKKICEDRREYRFGETANARLIDCEFAVKASDGPLTFGDTKEGSFALRLADTMKLKGGGGHIENSRGEKDDATWGKRAEWVDYFGPVDGETVGIAIFDHPKNFRHPTYWHVRDYGLFAANPFGIHDFIKSEPAGAGNHTVEAGKTLTFRYRVLIHKGTTTDAKIAEAWKEYANKISP